jgi:hypothetical protein
MGTLCGSVTVPASRADELMGVELRRTQHFVMLRGEGVCHTKREVCVESSSHQSETRAALATPLLDIPFRYSERVDSATRISPCPVPLLSP